MDENHNNPKPSQPTPIKKSSNTAVVVTVVIIIFVFIVLIGIGSSGSDNTTNTATTSASTTTTASSAPSQSQPALALTSLVFSEQQDTGYFCVAGEVKNISPSDLQFVQVNFDLRDSNGNLLNTDQTYLSVDDLSSGNSATFNDCQPPSAGAVLNKSTVEFSGQVGTAIETTQLNYENETQSTSDTTESQQVTPTMQSAATTQTQVQAPTPAPTQQSAVVQPAPASQTPQPTWHTVYTVSNDFNDSSMAAEGPFTLQGSETRVTISCALTYGASSGALAASLYVPHTNASFPSGAHCPVDGDQFVYDDVPAGQYSLMISEISNGQGSGNLQSYTVTVEDYY